MASTALAPVEQLPAASEPNNGASSQREILILFLIKTVTLSRTIVPL